MELSNNIHNDYIKIKSILNEFEKNHNLIILYACETGSRAVGISVEESDYDIKGLYIASEDEYLRVVRSVSPIIVQHHISVEINSKQLDLDLELRDIRDYFIGKIEKSYSICDFWFFSKIIYINEFPTEIHEVIKNHLTYPVFLFSPNDKSGIKTLEFNAQNGKCPKNKKILNLLISAIQFLHSNVYELNQLNFMKFPYYNIFQEIEYLTNNIDILSSLFSKDEVNLFLENFKLVEKLYNRKKVERLSTIKNIPDCLSKFVNLLTIKYHPEKKRKTLKLMKGSVNIEWTERAFEQLLYKRELYF